jgi:hypothetical protein
VSSDYRNLACEHLAACELELREHLLVVTSQRDIYRAMTAEALTQLHESRSALRRLIDEYRDHRVRCLAADNVLRDDTEVDQ